MKKFIKFLLITLVLGGIAFSAITTLTVHKGHYYVLSEFDYEIDDDVNVYERPAIEIQMAAVEELMETISFGFKDDDICLISGLSTNYDKSLNRIYVKIFGEQYTLYKRFLNLVIEEETEDYSFKAVFKVDRSLEI